MSLLHRAVRVLVAYTDEEIEVMNRTCRGRGAVGATAIVPRLVREYAEQGDTILDFGAGTTAQHAQALRDDGYDVTAYEFGSNAVDGVHDPRALSKKYDVVYASNVLNVQPSERALDTTLQKIAKAVRAGGIFIGNLPASPRKGAYSGMTGTEGSKMLQTKLESVFSSVKRVHGASSVPVFLCRK